MKSGTTELRVYNYNPDEPKLVSFRYTLEGRITPKARPRIGGGRGYLPKNYRDWKQAAIAYLPTSSQPSVEIAIASL